MNKLAFKQLIGFGLLFILASCGTLKKPYYNKESLNWAESEQVPQNKQIHSLYLIGSGGELDDKEEHKNFVFDAVAELLKKDSSKTSLVFLGDNVYNQGLPPLRAQNRAKKEHILDAQLQLSTLHKGKTYFIPGNHDWKQHKNGGRKAVLRQEEYIKAFANKNVKFYPKNACGDPEVVKVNKDLVYVFLDSQWWLQEWSEEKNMNENCSIKSRGDLLKRVEEIFVDHKNDEIIVMLHHPLKSNGKHGGRFSLKQHIFPLTEINKTFWIPLPIIGSFYPMYRNITGSKQDLTHTKNKELIEGLEHIVEKLEVNVVFVSGHEHGMQFFENYETKYIVSGGGSRHDFIQKGGDLSYARNARGFSKINFHENNESWLEMYTIKGFDQEPVLEYRTQLRAPRQGTVAEDTIYAPLSADDSSKTYAANKKFAAKKFKKFWVGEHYRDIWATPVEAEVINLETKFGGLTPIKKGGGMASNSLRMEKEDGKQYILRSLNKNFATVVPPEFRELKAMEILTEANIACLPYGALIIPKLSESAGIYYTNPKLVYLKHQRGLGNYNSLFSEEFYLLEERPDDDWSDAAHFGNSSEIIGYTDLLELLKSKKNHFIDQKWVLKSRIFDLFIHDWDRHDDQWRWAKFEEDGKNIYRPIPRDRDQAFFNFTGVITWFVTTLGLKQFKPIKKDVKDVKHLAFQARYFDRYFLHELEWSEWEAIIKEMQTNVTNETIDQAIQEFPKEIMELKAVPKLANILKERRNKLMTIGKKLYDFLSKEVEITGTDNNDRFEIKQNEDGSLTIKHFIGKEDEEALLKYDRTFYPKETKEVRLYGLRGNDNFIINGVKNNAISLRIIGGEGDDNIINNVKGRRVLAYDDPKGMDFSGKVLDRRSKKLDVNEYDRRGITYNTSMPLPVVGYTVDEGVWIGGSFSRIRHGWRKTPYQSKQSLSLSFAPGHHQNTLKVGYEGHFPDVFGPLDFLSKLQVNFPYYENFFGLGGNSTNPFRKIAYHRVFMRHIDLEPMVRLNIGRAIHFDLGLVYQHRDIDKTNRRITNTATSFFTEDALSNRNYVGGKINYVVDIVDDKVFPTNGLIFSASASHLVEPIKKENVTTLNIESKFYLQLLVRPKLVLANNTGYMVTFGDRQLYHYPSLGNRKGLRGYRNERFRGNAAFYNNLDLRLRLVDWKNNILPMEIGVLGGFDAGKVYIDDGLKNPWKWSYTAGLWIEVLDAIVLQTYFSINKEQHMFSFLLGFNF